MRRLCFVTTCVVLAFAGCTSKSDDSGSTATTRPDRSAEPAYADHGPQAVGMRTLTLDDRPVEVYYPTTAPDAAEPTVDAPINNSQEWPVVLFAHGLFANARATAGLEADIASWGFVVAATEFVERGTQALVAGTWSMDVERDAAISKRTLDRLRVENESGGAFAGALDLESVGAVGHSVGGGTAAALGNDPEIDAVVLWAPYIETDPPTEATPTMIIDGTSDFLFQPGELQGKYDALNDPKRFVMIDQVGHSSFIDLCKASWTNDQTNTEPPITAFTTVIGLGASGCQRTDLDPDVAQRVTLHLTVAHLRDALGIDNQPVGLGDGIADAFDGVSMTYEHSP